MIYKLPTQLIPVCYLTNLFIKFYQDEARSILMNKQPWQIKTKMWRCCITSWGGPQW